MPRRCHGGVRHDDCPLARLAIAASAELELHPRLEVPAASPPRTMLIGGTGGIGLVLRRVPVWFEPFNLAQ